MAKIPIPTAMPWPNPPFLLQCHGQNPHSHCQEGPIPVPGWGQGSGQAQTSTQGAAGVGELTQLMDVFIGTLHVGQACEQDRDRSSIALVTEIWNSLRGDPDPSRPARTPHLALLLLPIPIPAPQTTPLTPPVPLGAAPVGEGDGGTWRGALAPWRRVPSGRVPWRGQGTAVGRDVLVSSWISRGGG